MATRLRRGGLADLPIPGANRMPVLAGGAAGQVLDLVKGHGTWAAGASTGRARLIRELPPKDARDRNCSTLA